MQTVFDGLHGRAQEGGDFAVGELADVEEIDHQTLVFRQGLDGDGDLVLDVPLFQQVGRVFLARVDVANCF